MTTNDTTPALTCPQCGALPCDQTIAPAEDEGGFSSEGIRQQAIGHLREMYRPAIDALGSSGRVSLRNFINNRAHTSDDLRAVWQSIETAPEQDGILHLRGVWVFSATTGKPLYFDAVAGYLEAGDFLAADGEDPGWRPEDYTHWMAMPELPAAIRALAEQGGEA